ncbi:EthD domain-containing protein [Vibrio quintilis]|uniref:EthD protein n=1 Tax=Vibrio quintilis TaxID=1117707 RepID=A0A1M7YTV4_9VIBR|nr:EthD domain-containing protein [Vibrio quintilis]SHO56084.1 EthD protein [Vibrio quintilis]
MLKLICLVKRHPSLSQEAFEKHWKTNHAALIRKHAGLLGIRGYVQNTRLKHDQAQQQLETIRGLVSHEFDGCAELWWDDMQSHLDARKTPEGAKALQEIIEDEQRFIDPSQSCMWYCGEHTVLALTDSQ